VLKERPVFLQFSADVIFLVDPRLRHSFRLLHIHAIFAAQVLNIVPETVLDFRNAPAEGRQLGDQPFLGVFLARHSAPYPAILVVRNGVI
jgi:hypothetical protein